MSSLSHCDGLPLLPPLTQPEFVLPPLPGMEALTQPAPTRKKTARKRTAAPRKPSPPIASSGTPPSPAPMTPFEQAQHRLVTALDECMNVGNRIIQALNTMSRLHAAREQAENDLAMARQQHAHYFVSTGTLVFPWCSCFCHSDADNLLLVKMLFSAQMCEQVLGATRAEECAKGPDALAALEAQIADAVKVKNMFSKRIGDIIKRLRKICVRLELRVHSPTEVAGSFLHRGLSPPCLLLSTDGRDPGACGAAGAGKEAVRVPGADRGGRTWHAVVRRVLTIRDSLHLIFTTRSNDHESRHILL